MAFDYRTALTDMASELLEVDHVREALFHLQRLVVRFPDADAFWRVGECLRQTGYWALALRAYEGALGLDPSHAQASVGLAHCLYESGKPDEAIRILEQTLSREPNNTEALLLLGRLRLIQGDVMRCLSIFQKASSLKPDDMQARLGIAQAYFLAGHTEVAEAVLMRAQNLDPELASIPNMLAVVYWKKGEPERAFEYIQRALALDARSSEMAVNYARMQSDTLGPELAAGLLRQYLAMYSVPSVQAELKVLREKMHAPASKAAPVFRRKKKDKLVVFVGNFPRSRIPKMSYGLRSAGWETVLLCQDTSGSDMTPFFDEVKLYKNDYQAFALATSYSPSVYHVFSSWSENIAVEMVKHKPGKIVYECYDVAEGIRTGEKDVGPQRYCIENADGLCCRDLRLRWMRRFAGYKLPSRLILFMDHCWDSPNDVEIKDPESDGIHLVLCGSFSVEKLGQTDCCFLSIAELLADQGIHLHIYPSPLQLLVENPDLQLSCGPTPIEKLIDSPQFEYVFSDYIELARRTPFFHIHRPMPAELLQNELRRYHAGITICEALTYGDSLHRYTPEQLRYCGSARLFDYLDAELPIILNKAYSFQYLILSRFKVAIDGTPQLLANAAELLKPLLSPEFKARAQQARSAYGVRNQIPRLITFYESL